MTLPDFRDQPYLYVTLTRFVGAEERLREWENFYDNIHFPRIRQVAGVMSANRYTSSADPRSMLAAYGLEHPDVFTSPAYLALPGITGWREEIVEWSRLVYSRIDVPGFETRGDLAKEARERTERER